MEMAGNMSSIAIHKKNGIFYRSLTRVELLNFLQHSQKLGEAVDVFIENHKVQTLESEGIVYLECDVLSEITRNPLRKYHTYIGGIAYVNIKYLPRICLLHYESAMRDETYEYVVSREKKFEQLVEKLNAINF